MLALTCDESCIAWQYSALLCNNNNNNNKQCICICIKLYIVYATSMLRVTIFFVQKEVIWNLNVEIAKCMFF